MELTREQYKAALDFQCMATFTLAAAEALADKLQRPADPPLAGMFIQQPEDMANLTRAVAAVQSEPHDATRLPLEDDLRLMEAQGNAETVKEMLKAFDSAKDQDYSGTRHDRMTCLAATLPIARRGMVPTKDAITLEKYTALRAWAEGAVKALAFTFSDCSPERNCVKREMRRAALAAAKELGIGG